MRHYSPFDNLLINFDAALRTVFGPAPHANRPNPAGHQAEAELSDADRRHVAGLMRVNHAGEIAAQGLYQGQALTARLDDVRDRMRQASEEENDHLAWCAERIDELGSHTSFLNPLWYAGSFGIGALAGLAGDKWSLGFVAETEKQVVRHLEDHLSRLPDDDVRSRSILHQMCIDEAQHATVALESGGAPLPRPVKQLMSVTSKVMTTTAYYL